MKNSSLKQVLPSKMMSKNTLHEQRKKSEDMPKVTKEFLRGNEKLCENILKNKKKKGGPYSKNERDARRREVHSLHFEYGYSAVKISEFLKTNRNTINGDISYWYSKIAKDWDGADPSFLIKDQVERLNLHRTRLREYLDGAFLLQERLAIQKSMLDVESKIGQIVFKMFHSEENIGKHIAHRLNKWMAENKKDDRYISYGDYLRVPSKNFDKIRYLMNKGESD